MPHAAASASLARVSRTVGLLPESDARDGALVTRFIQAKDEAAFAELVRRLGPMVLGVCRRLIDDGHLAEDAFQAVFLVLAHRASDVRPREGVRGWLYGVAVRTAKGARAMSVRRRSREVSVTSVPDRPEPVRDEPDADVVGLIDEEIASLPEHLRNAVVLCELEGRSRREVAGRLRIAEGTLSSRLAAARKHLAERLRQRGVVFSATALTTASAQFTAAHVPAALTAKAVLTATGTAVPPAVAILSRGVLRAMLLSKLKTAVPVALVAGGLLACATVVAQPSLSPPAASKSPKTPPVFTVRYMEPPAKAEPKLLTKGPNKLLFWRADHLTLIDPDGKNEKKVSEDKDKFSPGIDSRLSPDGKMVAFSVHTERVPAPGGNPERELYVRELTEKEPGLDLETACYTFAWSPDGTKIAVTRGFDAPPNKPLALDSTLVDVKTKEKKPLKMPDNHRISDWTRDGKYLLTYSLEAKDGKLVARLHLMNLDGTEYKRLTDGKQFSVAGRMSPDGKRVLFLLVTTPMEPQPRHELAVLDLASGKTTPLADWPLNGENMGYCWSPDGKRIAYAWRQIHDGKPADMVNKETESHLVVCDPDGKNQETIASEKARGLGAINIGGVDWR